MPEIAVFPIPNCITFPGTHFPLHVFEPRYRQMVQSCSETGMPIAICHVEKTLRPSIEGQPLDEALNTNQATYKPVNIVSAGPCTIVKVLEDGRLMANVSLQARYKMGAEKQVLPFLIVEGEPYSDSELNEQQQRDAEILKDKLLHRLIALTADKPAAQSMLNSDEWRLKTIEDFSFELFGILQTDPEVMQNILEMTSSLARMETALALLKNVPAQL